MDRDTAASRITDGLGFRSSLASKAVLRMQEAQRDLEKGKTLPRFLIDREQTIVTVAGTVAYSLPTRFLRFVDSEESPIYFYPDVDSELPAFLLTGTETQVLREFGPLSDQGTPQVVIHDLDLNRVRLFPPPDAAYTIYLTFYRGGVVLDTNVENSWLVNASEWLIGEAGGRLAADLRDAEAVALFANLERRGRAATFGEVLAQEDQFGPLVMGAEA